MDFPTFKSFHLKIASREENATTEEKRDICSILAFIRFSDPLICGVFFCVLCFALGFHKTFRFVVAVDGGVGVARGAHIIVWNDPSLFLLSGNWINAHKYRAWLWSVDRQNQFITTKINDFPTDEYIKFEIHQQQSGSAHRMHFLCLSLRFNLLLRLQRNTKTSSGNKGSGERRKWSIWYQSFDPVNLIVKRPGIYYIYILYRRYDKH